MNITIHTFAQELTVSHQRLRVPWGRSGRAKFHLSRFLQDLGASQYIIIHAAEKVFKLMH